jgi:hypothetical protein
VTESDAVNAFGGVRPAGAIFRDAEDDPLGSVRPDQNPLAAHPSPFAPQAHSCDLSRGEDSTTQGLASRGDPRVTPQTLKIPPHLTLRIPSSESMMSDIDGSSSVDACSAFGSPMDNVSHLALQETFVDKP